MSGSIEVRPMQLRGLAQVMNTRNDQIFESIRSKISSRELHNESLASKSQKERRKAKIYDNMFLRVDHAGLSKLITSFSDSYNRSGDVSILNRVVNRVNPPPVSVRDRFLRDLPGETRQTTKWYVGGDEWGSIGTSQTVLISRHKTVCGLLSQVSAMIDFHQGELEKFARPGSPLRHNTRICGYASRAFITRLNHVSEDAVAALDGVGGREGRSDAIVASVRNALDVLGRNIEIASAKAAELAEQAVSLADDAEAFDAQAATQISNFECSIAALHNPLLKRSQVDLAIYRAELLGDGKGIKGARADQHQQRFDTLERNLTDSMREVASFIANRGNGPISALCVEAIRVIDKWLVFVNQSVQVSIEEVVPGSYSYSGSTAYGAVAEPVKEFGDKTNRGLLRDYLGGVVEDIEAARELLKLQLFFLRRINIQYFLA